LIDRAAMRAIPFPDDVRQRLSALLSVPSAVPETR